MKRKNVTNELVLGNKDNTASHYRIKSGGMKVQLMAVVEGDKPHSKCEYLMCQVGYKSEFITAHIERNSPVKLFKLMDYVDWECKGKQVQHIEMSFEDYINPDAFLNVIVNNFFNLKKQIV